jgi:hypothetical protein
MIREVPEATPLAMRAGFILIRIADQYPAFISFPLMFLLVISVAYPIPRLTTGCRKTDKS